MADLFDLATLVGVQRRIKVAPRFWLQEFFKRTMQFDQEWIMFDRVFTDMRKLAPFVVPNVSGRPMRLDEFSTDRFKPAYSKQKDVVDYTMHMERVAGEALGGTLTIEQRRQAVVAYILMMQKEKLYNTFNCQVAVEPFCGNLNSPTALDGDALEGEFVFVENHLLDEIEVQRVAAVFEVADRCLLVVPADPQRDRRDEALVPVQRVNRKRVVHDATELPFGCCEVEAHDYRSSDLSVLPLGLAV